MLIDRFGRAIHYLRISVTDRCNLRCQYCQPQDLPARLSNQALLQLDEIVSIVSVAAELGIRRLRLTGGEPLTRPDLPDLVRRLKAIAGIEEIALTSNGTLLAEQALPLKQAGLDRVNISLDTLNPQTFTQITRGGRLEEVLKGIQAAEEAGLAPIKLNVVAMRGVNETEFADFVELTRQHAWQVRFIEYMPIATPAEGASLWLPPGEDPFISAGEIRAALAHYPLRHLPVSPPEPNLEGPAENWQIAGFTGQVGFIPAVSQHFCGACNRLRLTADGYLRPCLLSDHEIALLPAVRRGEDLRPLLLQAVQEKPQAHQLVRKIRPQTRCMAQIGG